MDRRTQASGGTCRTGRWWTGTYWVDRCRGDGRAGGRWVGGGWTGGGRTGTGGQEVGGQVPGGGRWGSGRCRGDRYRVGRVGGSDVGPKKYFMCTRVRGDTRPSTAHGTGRKETGTKDTSGKGRAYGSSQSESHSLPPRPSLRV